jgi:ABC-type glycerol-3-phosphate transport system permease component
MSAVRGSATLLKHAVLVVLALASLFPIYFMIATSVKNTMEFANQPWAPPNALQLVNYARALAVVLGPMLNSIVVVGVSVLAILLFSSMSAYSFAVLRFPGKELLYVLVFVLLLLPSFLTLVPLYLQITKLGLSHSYLALILPYVAGGQALAVFVLRAFFQGVSRELIEAARIDGAGDVRIYRSIMLPLSIPVLIAVGIINVIALWSDLLLPQLVLDQSHETVTMALVQFQGSAQTFGTPDFGPLMAAYVLSAIPLLLLFGFLMRYYVEGLTSGALKL